eukprot:TRINITY_DN17386_c0_g2_i1.p1 TRINITY_DN17386_c0_g2~~TRINITY_DN17386_c0_g2_i1.p1  ORF type:complete len:1094 (-),score=238.22 TRINITY_DN17386_c0_g2_i1:586-3867(-)
MVPHGTCGGVFEAPLEAAMHHLRHGTVPQDYLSPVELQAPSEDLVRRISDTSVRSLASSAAGDGEDISEWSISKIEKEFGTDRKAGLSRDRAAEVLQRDGPNELYKPPKPSLLMLFVMQLTGFIIVLLIISAVASIIVNATGPKADDWLSYTTGAAILLIVVINAGIAAWTEHQAGGALDALAKLTQPTIDVLREGEVETIATASVVRGDVVLLRTGDVIPADARIFEAENLKVSEMCLTGEPDDVSKRVKIKKRHGEQEKLTPDNMVFSGCSATSGRARGIVVETGMGTKIGQIAALMSGEKKTKRRCACCPNTDRHQTPLQKNIQALGAKLGILAIVVCTAVFIIGVILKTKDPENPQDPPWLYMILIAVTLAVAAIPEGIPLCVTISLSIGCYDMVNKHVLVRKLAAVETLGSASVICSDKTGTLTEGKMTLVQMYCGSVKYDVSGKGFDPTVGNIMRRGESAVPNDSSTVANEDLGVLSTLMSGMLCSNTDVVKTEDSDGSRWEPRGNSTEAPIVVAGMKLGFNMANLKEEYPRVFEMPFSSIHKMMLTVCKLPASDQLRADGMPLPAGSRYFVVCKGAPSSILDLCITCASEDGTPEAMTNTKRAELLDVVDEYSVQALRVLAVAVRPLRELPFDPKDDELTVDAKFAQCRDSLMFLGLLASVDPERDGVQESVDVAHGAGIRVVMITGDYSKTACAIARNVGIVEKGDLDDKVAVDCKDLRPTEHYLPDSQFDVLTAKTKVFARAKPEDKLQIVKSLQRQGLVAAMTGDGVNDAPALHQSDIGVAMNIQGTEVAKGASDMVLTDDNFVSIVAAVEKGRQIYAGIQKFVAFIMSVHIAEVVQIFMCIVLGIPVMRTPLQILFLILVTDLPPSIALGLEPGDDSIMNAAPRPRDEPVVLGWMWVSICMNAAVLSGVILGIYVVALMYYCEGAVFQEDIILVEDFDSKIMQARTTAFISLVYSENIRAYISRSFDRPFWVNFCGNKYMQMAILMAQAALYVAVLVPVLSDKVLLLNGRNIGWWGWLVSFVGPLGTLVFCELAKIVTAYQMRWYQAKLRRLQAEREKQVLPKDALSQAAAENAEHQALRHV